MQTRGLAEQPCLLIPPRPAQLLGRQQQLADSQAAVQRAQSQIESVRHEGSLELEAAQSKLRQAERKAAALQEDLGAATTVAAQAEAALKDARSRGAGLEAAAAALEAQVTELTRTLRGCSDENKVC